MKRKSIIILLTAICFMFTACGGYTYTESRNDDADTDESYNDTYEETQVTRGYVDVSAELTAIQNADSLVWGIPEDSVVTFGAYEQDGNLFNGPEPIEWYVINNDNDVASLYSVYCLDCRPYHNDSLNLDTVNWSNCSLKDWLNNDFYNEAFNEEEKQYVALNAVTGERTTDIDESTAAYVQLPNAGNVALSFWTHENMIAEFTEYAKSKYNSSEPYSYWTRELSEKTGPGYGTVIDSVGEIHGSSYYWTASNQLKDGVPMTDSYGVRPMIMVKLLNN
ncbi:MAG: DUF6273 domain-containing protein [Eubacterium sp.]